MSERNEPQPQNAALGESHRRIVAALFRGFEDMRAEIERWIDPAPGALTAIDDRLDREECERLRALLDRLDLELGRIARDLELDSAGRSAARSIEALLVEHLSLLQETSGGELRGYGAIGEGARRHLESEFARLQEIFQSMLRVVRRPPRGRSLS